MVPLNLKNFELRKKYFLKNVYCKNDQCINWCTWDFIPLVLNCGVIQNFNIMHKKIL